jgi:hypothetical protein
MRRVRVLVVACACFVLLLSAGAAPAQRSDDCTWGASLVLVQELNGKLVQSDPLTTGCVPG